MKLNAPISVRMDYSAKRRFAAPVKLSWENRDYWVKKLGYHHTYRKGRVLYHVYSVMSETIFFRLEMDTETMFWTVTEVDDGSGN